MHAWHGMHTHTHTHTHTWTNRLDKIRSTRRMTPGHKKSHPTSLYSKDGERNAEWLHLVIHIYDIDTIRSSTHTYTHTHAPNILTHGYTRSTSFPPPPPCQDHTIMTWYGMVVVIVVTTNIIAYLCCVCVCVCIYI